VKRGLELGAALNMTALDTNGGGAVQFNNNMYAVVREYLSKLPPGNKLLLEEDLHLRACAALRDSVELRCACAKLRGRIAKASLAAAAEGGGKSTLASRKRGRRGKSCLAAAASRIDHDASSGDDENDTPPTDRRRSAPAALARPAEGGGNSTLASRKSARGHAAGRWIDA